MIEKVKRILKIIKSVIFSDPKRLYQEEVGFINKPFYFKGDNQKAILLIHGWTSTPYELRRLGRYLNEKGYTAFGIQLRGHGTVPKDLEDVRWQDWLEDVNITYQKLKASYKQVFVVGTSIGSNIAILLAAKNPEIAGIILMATPYKVKWEKLSVFFAKLHLKIKKYNRKFYPPTFGVSTTITRLIAYQTYPIQSALEVFDLIKFSRKKISSVTQPCFILQSSHDHIVAKKSMENIYQKINSRVKKKKYIHKAYHTFISDIKNENVFRDIFDFIKSN